MQEQQSEIGILQLQVRQKMKNQKVEYMAKVQMESQINLKSKSQSGRRPPPPPPPSSTKGRGRGSSRASQLSSLPPGVLRDTFDEIIDPSNFDGNESCESRFSRHCAAQRQREKDLDQPEKVADADDKETISTELINQMKRMLRGHGPEPFPAENLPAMYRKMYEARLTVDVEELTSAMANQNMITMHYDGNMPSMRIKPLQSFLDDFENEQKNSPVNVKHFYDARKFEASYPLPEGIQKAKIPDQELPPGTEIGDLVDVYVSNTTTPSDFYVQLLWKCPAFDQLMDDLDDFYCSAAGAEYAVKPLLIGVIGLPIATIYYNQVDFKSQGWHRAVVLGVKSLNQFEVLYVDYGTKSIVYRQHCRYLLSKFAALPCQALRASLTGVLPKKLVKRSGSTSTSKRRKRNKQDPNTTFSPSPTDWSAAAITRFSALARSSNMVMKSGCVAKVCEMTPGSNLSLVLYDTSTNDLPTGIIFNDVLIREGLAVKDPAWLRDGFMPWEFRSKHFENSNKLNRVAEEEADKSSKTLTTTTTSSSSSRPDRREDDQHDQGDVDPETLMQAEAYMMARARGKVCNWLVNSRNNFSSPSDYKP